MDLIRHEGTLAKHVFETTIVSRITAKILEIPEFRNLKYDCQLVMFVANIIETEMGDKKTTEEKHALVKSILQPIFSYDGDDLGIIQNQLHFLCDNKKVKPLSTKKYVWRAIGSWFTRKIL